MILGVAVVALDCLVEKRPAAVGALRRGRAEGREEDERGKPDRGGTLVKQGRLCAVKGCVAGIGMGGSKLGQSRQHFPAGLGLGPVERVDKIVKVGSQLLRVLTRHDGQLMGRILPASAV